MNIMSQNKQQKVILHIQKHYLRDRRECFRAHGPSSSAPRLKPWFHSEPEPHRVLQRYRRRLTQPTLNELTLCTTHPRCLKHHTWLTGSMNSAPPSYHAVGDWDWCVGRKANPWLQEQSEVKVEFVPVLLFKALFSCEPSILITKCC